MAIRTILTGNNPTLREKCREVTEFDEHLAVLIDDMKETMLAADGVGLAAPQVGIIKRVVVISRDQELFYELVNPVITKSSGSQINVEACLSLPGVHGSVERPASITVEAQDRHGEKRVYNIKGFLAVIFCHEIDHLDGILYSDKVIGGLTEDKK